MSKIPHPSLFFLLTMYDQFREAADSKATTPAPETSLSATYRLSTASPGSKMYSCSYTSSPHVSAARPTAIAIPAASPLKPRALAYASPFHSTYSAQPEAAPSRSKPGCATNPPAHNHQLSLESSPSTTPLLHPSHRSHLYT